MRLDVNVDAYVPADYIPYEQAKVDVHRRIAASREVADLVLLREELEDRFGELPEPLRNLIALQQARIKLGQAGARAVTFRGGRLAVTPIELDSVRAKKIRAEIPEALYESGKSQLSMRVPEDPGKRFPAVVRAADVLLAVTRERGVGCRVAALATPPQQSEHRHSYETLKPLSLPSRQS